MIAAVFETKIRFRLLGPNPKFYCSFYIKDNSYFDLTTLKSHEFAHQISQEQINHMFYLSSSLEEQKRANWGWMNIEDWDYAIDNLDVSSIDFVSNKLNDKSHQFLIKITSGNNTYNLNSRIVL